MRITSLINKKHIPTLTFKRPVSLFAVLSFVATVGFMLLSSAPVTDAAGTSCQPTGTTYGTDSIPVSVQVATTYNVWVRLQSPSSSVNSIFLQVDPPQASPATVGPCFTVGGASITPNTWTWDNYQNGSTSQVMQVTLPAGSHTLYLIGTEPGIQVDNILLLSDASCVPTGTGTNCTTGQPDTTPPTVSVTAPTAGQNVSGTTTLSANASDNVSVASVQFTLDGNNLGSPVTTSPYTYSWNSASVANGTHTISAIATDEAGLKTTATNVSITVNNVVAPPYVQNFKWNTSSKSLSWTAYPGATAYKIAEVHNPTTSRTPVNYTCITGTTYTPTPLNNVTVNYGIHPETKNPDGSCADITTANWVPAAGEATVIWPDITPPPSTPTSLTGKAVSSTNVSLNWTENNTSGGLPIAGYDIYRNGTLVGGSTSTSYSDTTAQPNTTYSYTVDAFDNATPPHVSSLSASASVTTPKTPPPSAPSNVSATANSATSVAVSWSENNTSGGNAVGGYYVLRNGTQIASVAGISNTKYTDNNVSANTTYTYTVEAYDTATPPNVSAQSSDASVTTPKTPPPTAPTTVTATANSYNSVSVSWGASKQSTGGLPVAGYYIIRNGVTLGQVSSGNLSYTDNAAQANTTYQYSIEAFDTATPPNVSSAANANSVTTPNQGDTQPPTTPASLIAKARTSSQINLTWAASTDNIGVKGYYVYRNGNLAGTVTTNSYGDTGLSPQTNYVYYVIAFDAAGNKSQKSLTANATTKAAVPTLTVQGRVTSAATQNALAGAYVHTGIFGTSNGAAIAYTNTGGYYTLANVTANRQHSYTFSDTGYRNHGLHASYPVGTTTLNEALTPRTPRKK